jgi:hypothetical protein
MYGDAALPHNDWGNSIPVGHILSCCKKFYKPRDSSPSTGGGLLADKVKSILLLFPPCNR